MEKSIKRIFILMLMAVVSLSVIAQDKSYSKWTSKMLKQKHEFIVKTAKITPEQERQFMPIYEKMEQEIYQLNVQSRDAANRVAENRAATDDDYAQAALMMAGVKQKEGEIELRYHEQFAQILSKKQMFLLKRAEKKFTRDMIQKKNKKK